MPSNTLDPIDRAEVLTRLAQQPILRSLERPALEALLAYAQPKGLRARGRLFAAGDAGSALYLVLSGWIKLTRTGPSGRDIVLELAGPGSLFGELAVLCGLPRAADAVALSACRVVAIDGRAVIAALRAHPDALLRVTVCLEDAGHEHATRCEPVEAREQPRRVDAGDVVAVARERVGGALILRSPTVGAGEHVSEAALLQPGGKRPYATDLFGILRTRPALHRAYYGRDQQCCEHDQSQEFSNAQH